MNSIVKTENGVYRWVYELPMWKSLFLLKEVWLALGAAASIPLLVFFVVCLFRKGGMTEFRGFLVTVLIVLGILLVLSVPAYLIVTAANNGKYTVLFEMDEEGIDHIQIKTDKASALEKLLALAGAASGNPSMIGQSLLQSSGGSLYSRFIKVKQAKAYPEKNLIVLNGMLIRNQVYAEADDFDFVWQFIKEHCINARIVE